VDVNTFNTEKKALEKLAIKKKRRNASGLVGERNFCLLLFTSLLCRTTRYNSDYVMNEQTEELAPQLYSFFLKNFSMTHKTK
jgi:hypothetical protein